MLSIVVVVVLGFRVFVFNDVVPIAHSGGAEFGIKRHAPHGAVEEVDADVENPLRAAGGTANLEGYEAELGFAVGREEVGNQDGDGADEDLAEPGVGVDLDHDDGVVGIEEVVVDAEDKLLVPGGVGVANLRSGWSHATA